MVWQNMVCDKVVCERWCVTKTVCDKVVCDKVVCQRWCESQPSVASATPATQSHGRCHPVPRLPRKTKVDVAKCHACHARRPGAHGNPLRHQSPPSAVSATPATQSEGGCHPVPHLPRKTKVDVAKCHACHAKRRWMSPRATPATRDAAAPTGTRSPSAVSFTPATQSEGGCHPVPRLPRKVKVDDKLWDDKLCVGKLCVSKLCVIKLCV